MEELVHTNHEILQALEEFEKSPERNRAFHIALKFETGAGELHYDTFMKHRLTPRLLLFLKSLTGMISITPKGSGSI